MCLGHKSKKILIKVNKKLLKEFSIFIFEVFKIQKILFFKVEQKIDFIIFG
jgi:hypothetical protein